MTRVAGIADSMVLRFRIWGRGFDTRIRSCVLVSSESHGDFTMLQGQSSLYTKILGTRNLKRSVVESGWALSIAPEGKQVKLRSASTGVAQIPFPRPPHLWRAQWRWRAMVDPHCLRLRTLLQRYGRYSSATCTRFSEIFEVQTKKTRERRRS